MGRLRNALIVLLFSVLSMASYQDSRKFKKLFGTVTEDFEVFGNSNRHNAGRGGSFSGSIDNDLRDSLNSNPHSGSPNENTNESNSFTGGGNDLGSFGDGFGDPPGTNPTDNDQVPENNRTISPSQPG